MQGGQRLPSLDSFFDVCAPGGQRRVRSASGRNSGPNWASSCAPVSFTGLLQRDMVLCRVWCLHPVYWQCIWADLGSEVGKSVRRLQEPKFSGPASSHLQGFATQVGHHMASKGLHGQRLRDWCSGLHSGAQEGQEVQWAQGHCPSLRPIHWPVAGDPPGWGRAAGAAEVHGRGPPVISMIVLFV